MKVKWKTTKNDLPKMTETLEALSGKRIEVGAIDGEHAWLAGIHEHGAFITPKKSQYLTVPCHPKAVGKSAREFSDLWTYRAKSGELFLCKNRGKDAFDVYYWLTKSVTIPPRPFLVPSHDEKGMDVLKSCEKALGLVIGGEMSLDEYMDMVGRNYATMIKTYIRDLKEPPNSPVTIEAKGSDNPLIGKTNGLIESISYRVK